ncbi:hypothetical protein ANAPC5_01414 [Anaplasma phagocytophilum]|nr:hypothetical protein ANAPC5_01414 [Anaplasma phagocytophilum]
MQLLVHAVRQETGLSTGVHFQFEHFVCHLCLYHPVPMALNPVYPDVENLEIFVAGFVFTAVDFGNLLVVFTAYRKMILASASSTSAPERRTVSGAMPSATSTALEHFMWLVVARLRLRGVDVSFLRSGVISG